MKKFFKTVIFALIISLLFVTTGCNLFPQNQGKYLRESVATLNFKDGNKETIEITREEFLTAYNNYGAQLIQNGSSEEDAKNKTMTALINRKALVRAAKNSEKISLTDKGKQKLYYETYKAMISNAEQYEDEYKEEKGIDKMSDSQVESGTVYTPYEKKAKVVYEEESIDGVMVGKYVIKKVESDDVAPSVTFTNLKEAKDQFVLETKGDDQHPTSTYKQVSYRRYLNSLKETQTIKGTDYTVSELMFNEAQRIYDNLEENWYVEKYQELYTENNGYSSISVDQVLQKYKSMITSDNFEYSANTDSFNTAMLSTTDFKKVDYFVNDNYFYVTHILIKLSDEQSQMIKDIETKVKNGTISELAAKSQKEEIYNAIMASERNANGVVEDGKNDYLSVNTLLSNLNRDLAVAREKVDPIEKKSAITNVFKDYLYKYNEDDGIMNAEYPYVVGINDSKMVEGFTNASRELNENGEYGAISGLVESEYGVHIIMYLGKCENLFTISSDNTINLTNEDVLKMDQTLLNPLNNKTVFDKVYESLEKDNYSILLNMQMTELTSKDVLKYTIHSDKL